MNPLDPFNVSRTALFIALTAYTLVTGAVTMLRVIAILRGDDPRKRLLRLYLSYQLLTVRVRPLAGELFGLAIWSGALLTIWWLHTRI